MMGYRSLELGDLGEQLGVEGKSRVPLEHTGLGCAEQRPRISRVVGEAGEGTVARTLLHQDRHGDRKRFPRSSVV